MTEILVLVILLIMFKVTHRNSVNFKQMSGASVHGVPINNQWRLFFGW